MDDHINLRFLTPAAKQSARVAEELEAFVEERVKQRKRVTVSEVAAKFSISEQTVRNVLLMIEREDLKKQLGKRAPVMVEDYREMAIRRLRVMADESFCWIEGSKRLNMEPENLRLWFEAGFPCSDRRVSYQKRAARVLETEFSIVLHSDET